MTCASIPNQQNFTRHHELFRQLHLALNFLVECFKLRKKLHLIMHSAMQFDNNKSGLLHASSSFLSRKLLKLKLAGLLGCIVVMGTC